MAARGEVEEFDGNPTGEWRPSGEAAGPAPEQELFVRCLMPVLFYFL